MKVLLVHNFYKYSGGEDSYFYSLKSLLEKKGHRVITYTKNNSSIKSGLWNKLKSSLNLLNPYGQAELNKFVMKEKPDIAHFNNVYPLISPFAYRICKKNGISVVQTVHNYRMICPGGIMFKDGKICPHAKRGLNKLLSNCYRNSLVQTLFLYLAIRLHFLIGSFDNIDSFIFPAEYTLSAHRDMLPKEKFKLLPYFTENIGLKSPKKSGDYFFYAGRFSPEKGLIDLLEVFKKLPFKLVVAGDGELKDKVNTFKKYENIQIMKHVDKKQIIGYMKGAIATIIPSKWPEVGPIVMLESFSAGKPVIVPKFGVFAKTVGEAKTGWFFKFCDLKSLEKTVNNIYDNRSMIAALGNECLREYNSKYTKEIHYKALMKIYKLS